MSSHHAEDETAATSLSAEIQRLNREFNAGTITLRQYISDMADLGQTVDAVALQFRKLQLDSMPLTQGLNATGEAFGAISAAMENMYNIVDNVVDVIKGNVDEQVNLYKAQIDTVRAQNFYSQSLALHATAVQMFGQNSLVAQRTQIAVNYQQALLGQAQKNQIVANIQYNTAYLKNLAEVGASAVQTATQLLTLVAAIRVLGAIGATTATAGTLGRVGTLALGVGRALPLVTGGMIGYGVGAGIGQVVAGPQGAPWGGLAGALAGTGLMGIGLGLAPETLGLSLLATGLIASEPLWGKYLGLPTFQHGGVVPRTGPVFAHAGEVIVPRDKASSAMSMPSVPINIYVSSEVDLSKVRQVVSEEIAKAQLKTMRSRGGVYP